MYFVDFQNKEQLARYMDGLHPDAKPSFGIMTPQHMVEHLSLVLTISNGKRTVNSFIPEEKWEKARLFLEGPEPLRQGIKIPFVSGELPKLYFENLNAAVLRLYKEIDDLENHFKQNSNSTPVHPYFGPLSKNAWIKFHNKHFTHHLRQFNLL